MFKIGRCERKGLSQRELASEGVSYAYFSRLEANARQPSVTALRKLAPKLAVSPHWLETGERNSHDSSSSIASDHCRDARTDWHAPFSATRVRPKRRHYTD